MHPTGGMFFSENRLMSILMRKRQYPNHYSPESLLSILLLLQELYFTDD